MFLRKLNIRLRRAVQWLMRAVDVPCQSKMVISGLILDSDCYRIPYYTDQPPTLSIESYNSTNHTFIEDKSFIMNQFLMRKTLSHEL